MDEQVAQLEYQISIMSDNREATQMLDNRASLIASVDGILITLVLLEYRNLGGGIPLWLGSYFTFFIVGILLILATSMVLSTIVARPMKPLTRPEFLDAQEGVERLKRFNAEVEATLSSKFSLFRYSYSLFLIGIVLMILILTMTYAFSQTIEIDP